MRKKPVLLTALILVFTPFQFCNKTSPFFPNPLTQNCQVAEYHNVIYDPYFSPHIPFVFKKTFDASGTIVKEIEFFFWEEVGPESILFPEFHHLCKVEQSGRMIFLISELSIGDTMARIKLNSEGRAESCTGNTELDPDFGNNPLQIEYYSYKEGHLVAFKTVYSGMGGNTFTQNDTLIYDKYGNLLSFRDNVYQYDYSRKAKQQFYEDDFMGGVEPFYLLQYLGFFPEVTSPVNIRSHITTGEPLDRDISNLKFDAEGKLTSYIALDTVRITWNCSKKFFK